MMNHLLLLIFLFLGTASYGQEGFGFDFGFATSESVIFDVKYFKDKNAFSLGVTYEFNDAVGKKVSEQLSNYGKTITGTGDYFSTLDIAYARILSKKLALTGELSVGGRNYYTNYSDKRFTDDGYHLIDKTTSLIGFGGLVTYSFNDTFGLFCGYNTIRLASFGLQIKFIQ